MRRYSRIFGILGVLISCSVHAEVIKIPAGTNLAARLDSVAPLLNGVNGIPMRAMLGINGNDKLSSLFAREACFVTFKYQYANNRINGRDFSIRCNRANGRAVSFEGVILGLDGQEGVKPGKCYGLQISKSCPATMQRSLDLYIRVSNTFEYRTNS